MPQRWAIWLSVDGDLRFASHRDMMRSAQRVAARAGLDLRYTQGFNPHPILSLVPPRPVGVASRDDLLVVKLQETTDAASIVSRLEAASPPRGLTFGGASKLPDRTNPQPRRCRYELPLDPGRMNAVAANVERLAGAESWPVERMIKTRQGRRRTPAGFATKTVDLRPRVDSLRVADGRLCFTVLSDQAGQARPGEVLALCGLDERIDLASLVRIGVDYCLDDQTDFRIAGVDGT